MNGAWSFGGIRALLVRCCVCVALCLYPAAGPAGDTGYALQSGSPRLLLFAILKERPAGSDRAAVQLLRKLAFDPNQPRGLIGADASVRPTIAFDPNINSGIPADRLVLGGFTFDIAESSQAKPGIVVGARMVSVLQSRVAFGRTVSFGAELALGLSPEHSLWKSDAAIFACSQNHLGNWTFLDACLTASARYRELSRKSWVTPEVAVTRVFGTQGGSHEVRAAIGHEIHPDYDKSYVSLSSKHAIGDVGLGSFGLYLGERVDGVQSRLASFSMEIGRYSRSGYGSVGLMVLSEGGANLFGVEREDRAVRVHISRIVRNRFEIEFSVESRNSSISAYDGVSTGISLRLVR